MSRPFAFLRPLLVLLPLLVPLSMVACPSEDSRADDCHAGCMGNACTWQRSGNPGLDTEITSGSLAFDAPDGPSLLLSLPRIGEVAVDGVSLPVAGAPPGYPDLRVRFSHLVTVVHVADGGASLDASDASALEDTGDASDAGETGPAGNIEVETRQVTFLVLAIRVPDTGSYRLEELGATASYCASRTANVVGASVGSPGGDCIEADGSHTHAIVEKLAGSLVVGTTSANGDLEADFDVRSASGTRITAKMHLRVLYHSGSYCYCS